MTVNEAGTLRDPGGGVYYIPFVNEGRVGYRVVRPDPYEETFIYFNPSLNTEAAPDDPNVFVYTGTHDDPALDEPQHFYKIAFGEG